MVAHACNPGTWRGKQEDEKFKVILGYGLIFIPVIEMIQQIVTRGGRVYLGS